MSVIKGIKMKLLKLFIAAIISGSMAASAFAADGRIDFNGRITKATCTVDASTADPVNLPEVGATALAGKGKTGGDTLFSINLKDCGIVGGSANVQVKFDGVKDRIDGNLLKINSESGGATGVGIGIYEKNGSTLINMGELSKSTPVTKDVTKLEFKAKYVATGETVTPGTVKASTDFTLDYE
ncbi:fimbrial protein [Xenorhabdus bovienii]|uniref:Putative fimbrial-like adhesin protein n=1 Tax=Xenorhabdus bovienii str. feltiae Moldova TaxID=1398200 RepID=A0A077NW72_XENBV|nr:fimbrial protein [Xenorhabdus bovienii]CDH03125.1 putative fimbrial-like adhesin protein [Xenorhabdus bovienii str. feltiae Moldova]